MDFDTQLLLKLNSLAVNPFLHELFDFLGNNPLARGGPVFFALMCIWASKANDVQRARLFIGIAISFIAVFLSVATQFVVTPHVRPFMATTLAIHSDVQDMHLHRDGSFPSDTASLYFALSTVIFLERRLWGVLAGIWSFLTVGLCRVALAYHYPSDILGGFVLGSGLVLLCTQIKFVPVLVERGLEAIKPYSYLVNAAMLLLMADAYTQFIGVLGFVHAAHVFAALIHHHAA